MACCSPPGWPRGLLPPQREGPGLVATHPHPQLQGRQADSVKSRIRPHYFYLQQAPAARRMPVANWEWAGLPHGQHGVSGRGRRGGIKHPVAYRSLLKIEVVSFAILLWKSYPPPPHYWGMSCCQAGQLLS